MPLKLGENKEVILSTKKGGGIKPSLSESSAESEISAQWPSQKEHRTFF